MRNCLRILVVCAMAWLAGCQPRQTLDNVARQDIILPASKIKPSASTKVFDSVLEQAVNSDGNAIVHRLPKVAAALKSQLQTMAITGPTATPELYPTKGDRLAYWFNARAAWSLELLRRAIVADDDIQADPGLKKWTFPLDGRRMSLLKIDERLESLRGPSAVIAAPSVMFHRAGLPQESFAGKTVKKQIAKRISAFICDPKRFIINVEAQTVEFPPVLWKYRQPILEFYTKKFGPVEPTLTTAMLPMVKGAALRRLQDAVGYRCVRNQNTPELAVER